MKSEKENEKVNLDEMGVVIGVDSEVIEKVRSGGITHILVDINEDNRRESGAGDRRTARYIPRLLFL